MSRAIALAAFVLSLAGCVSDQHAEVPVAAAVAPLPTPVTYIPTGQEVPPPYGFIGFCLRNEADCDGGTDTPSNVALTQTRWSELNAVNDFVNRQPQMSDEQRYGVQEYWTYADAGGGDCEDLALEKRRLLIARGWRADALLLATAKGWDGEGHAVLLAETDKGELVLDNKNWAIVPSRAAPYIWQARQSRERPYIWVDLDPHSFRQMATVRPPLGAPIPFIAAIRTASFVKRNAAARASSGALHKLRLDPHMDIVADSRPPG